MRYLAIDYGTRRTGLAICDAQETIASPLAVVQGQKDLLPRIARIVAIEGVGGIVLGLPLNMDGSEGPQAGLVKAFAQKLAAHVPLPVHFQDERLSSFAASEKLEQAEYSRARKRARIDAVAAADILQSFLERTKSQASQ
jgi:putative Holliday junction resolvase